MVTSLLSPRRGRYTTVDDRLGLRGKLGQREVIAEPIVDDQLGGEHGRYRRLSGRGLRP